MTVKQTALGSYIRSLRRQNGMTQVQLARKLAVTDKAVSKWERGVSCPDLTLFPELANVLGVTVSDLLNESLEEGRPSRLVQIFKMSHDIRTPLHIIIGCANLAEFHRDEPELLTKYLESIRISGEYLLKSVDRLMKVTYQDADDSKEDTYPSNVQELGECLTRHEEKQKDTGEDFQFTGKRILVAEDIRMNREIAAEILKRTGAEVEFAEDGEVCLEMVEAAKAGTYDLILMDIMMPKMDGLEATRRIRALPDPEKAAVPVVALSANVYEKERKMAMEAGMNAFAEKPISVNLLLETIRKQLQVKRISGTDPE